MSVVQHLRQSKGAPADLADLIARAAAHIGCAEAVLKAILKVESGGDAYDAHGRLIILPEKHIFWRYLPKGLRAKAAALGLAAPKWLRANYKGLGGIGSDRRWDRLQKMGALHEEAALKSASYGSAQIMGFNHKICGFSTVTEFVLALAEKEEAQIDAFLKFLLNCGLAEELRAKNFRAIARRYNGPGQVSYYAGLMEKAYRDLGGGDDPETIGTNTGLLRLGSEGYRVKALQQKLSELGYVVRPDGDFGPATKRAVITFQADHGLLVDGVAGPKTEAMLEKAVPMSEQPGGARQGLRVKDLRKQGSRTVKNADWLSRIGMALFGTGAAATGLEDQQGGFLDGLLSQLPGGLDMLQTLRADLQPLLDLVTANKWLALVAAGLAVVVIARQIKRRRLDDARNWRHVG
ncbi:N-acetylmuramidase domain-containing protein [Roseibium alexandrii]|uniref:N-acetylmuramidase domain-containing protein n=1 Tax=Roseibium alexandrii TaxID=388408 RepID=UPI00375157B6